MDRDGDEGPFSCIHCDLNLSGQRYVKSNDQPYCVKCYETLFANTCAECKKVIGTGSKDLSYNDLHWHEACFKCNDCQEPLANREFATVDNKLYCSDCHDRKFAARCDVCQQVFRSGMKKYEFGGKKFHENCFVCCECRQPIVDNSFVPRDDKFYCNGCFDNRFGNRCAKCKQVIRKGGLTFKETAWHRECFTCEHCAKTLAEQKFTTHEGKPYCAECHALLFAKKCFRCGEAITGFGQTKFVTSEDKNWHTDCFQCVKCKVPLAGKGFLFKDSDVMCANCGAEEDEEEKDGN